MFSSLTQLHKRHLWNAVHRILLLQILLELKKKQNKTKKQLHLMLHLSDICKIVVDV